MPRCRRALVEPHPRSPEGGIVGGAASGGVGARDGQFSDSRGPRVAQGGYPAVGSIVTTTGSQRGVAHATSPQTSPRSLPQQQQQQPQPQPTPSAPPSAAAGGAPAQVPAAGPQQHQQQQQPQPLGNVMFIPQNLERYLQEEGMRHIDELVEASECPQLAGGAHDSPAGAAGPAGTES
eukprot:TRINITY_DN13802_c0_g1_i3.p1 TRINITY_DN13802_c0_g1~~TRINITY_DN13802_c0_g1_i3.p1  ORF type:complete len:178 (+),score=32.67 TRINITY_DN13802_c0_g1_i3:89-622(+)